MFCHYFQPHRPALRVPALQKPCALRLHRLAPMGLIGITIANQRKYVGLFINLHSAVTCWQE